MTRLGLALALLAVIPQDPPPATDAVGDPIPAGAAYRIGNGRFQHGDPITGLRFAADGKRLFSSSMWSIRAWDVGDGRRVATITGQYGGLESMAVAPDGKTVYSTGCNILQTYAWDVETGKEKFQLLGPGEGPNFTGGAGQHLAVSGDGKRLATAIRDDAFRVWDLEKRREILKRVTFEGEKLHYSGGTDISPDGKLMTALGPKALFVFEVDTGAVALRIDGMGRLYPRFSADSRKLATGAAVRDGYEAWDLVEKKRLFHVKASYPLGFRWAPDGSACAWWDNSAVLIGDPATGEVRRKIEGPLSGAFDFSPDGTKLAVATGHTIRLFDPATGRELTDTRRNVATYNSTAAWTYSPDGRLIAVPGNYSAVRIYEAVSGREVSYLGSVGSVVAIAFSEDGRTLTTLESESGKPALARRWDVLAGREIARREHDSKTYGHGCGLSPDGRYLTGSAYQPVPIVDAISGAAVTSIPNVAVMAWSPDGRRALLRGRKVSLIEWETQKEMWTGDYQNFTESGTFFTPDGRHLILALQNQVRVIDANTGKALRDIPLDAPGTSQVYMTALSTDGRTIATQTYDSGRIDHWDRENPVTSRTFLCSEKVSRIRFSPDGSSWASSFLDGTLLVWKLKPDPPQPKLAGDSWDRLSSKDLVEAWTAANALSDSKEAVAVLRKKLQDRASGTPKADEAMRKLVADLDAEEIPAREKAFADLRTAGRAAELALLLALDAKPSAEAQVMIRRLLDEAAARLVEPGEESRRVLAIRVLGRTKADGATDLLEAIRAKAPTWIERLTAAEALAGRKE